MRRICFAALTLAASAGPVARAADPPAADPREGEPSQFDGQVTAVDGESVTVRGFGAGLRGWDRQRPDPDGRGSTFTGPRPFVVTLGGVDHVCRSAHRRPDVWTLALANGEVKAVRRADLPPRRFPVSPVLAAGGYDERESAAVSYRLADVRVGDEVYLECRREAGAEVCRAISITRRPGGRVPEAPGQKPDDRHKHHEAMNAYADWDEKGIPPPDKYNVLKRGEVAARHLEYLRARREGRIAPPPRLAKPKPPDR